MRLNVSIACRTQALSAQIGTSTFSQVGKVVNEENCRTATLLNDAERITVGRQRPGTDWEASGCRRGRRKNRGRKVREPGHRPPPRYGAPRDGYAEETLRVVAGAGQA